MTALTTHVLGPNGVLRKNLFAPFTIEARFVQSASNPFSGNRWEQWRAEQKTAEYVELALRNFVEHGVTISTEDDYKAYIAFPIAFTRQFGNQPARITISGSYKGSNLEIDTSGDVIFFPPKKIANNIDLLNANELRNGQGSFDAANLDPKEIVNQFANQINDLLMSVPLTTQAGQNNGQTVGDLVEVMSTEVFGIKYGRRARHFSPS
jgi:hypothetical protein